MIVMSPLQEVTVRIPPSHCVTQSQIRLLQLLHCDVREKKKKTNAEGYKKGDPVCPAYYLLLLCARGVFSGLLSLYGVGPANTDARALWGFASYSLRHRGGGSSSLPFWVLHRRSAGKGGTST